MRMCEILESVHSEDRKHESILNLLNLIRAKADQQGVAAVLPASSFFKLLSNVGYDLTPEEFEQLQSTVPAIGSMITSVDDKTVTVASSQQPPEDSEPDVVQDTSPGNSGTVRKMAARAAKRRD